MINKRKKNSILRGSHTHGGGSKKKIIDKDVKKTIMDMVKKIKDKYKPEKLVLFGSYAYGKPRKDSDIDLLIIKKTKRRHIERVVKVREIIKKENRSFAVEPLVYTPQEINERLNIGDDFIKNILERGIVLWSKKR